MGQNFFRQLEIVTRLQHSTELINLLKRPIYVQCVVGRCGATGLNWYVLYICVRKSLIIDVG